MNLQLILIFIFSILFVTIHSDELVPLKQSTPNPVVIKKGGDNKLHIDVSWEGLAIGEKGKSDIISKTVTYFLFTEYFTEYSLHKKKTKSLPNLRVSVLL
jgi:hypothetical protein